jgi:hypothetical protein
MGDRPRGPSAGKGETFVEITEWIIKISIFGVLAVAVIGTVQNLLRSFRKR